MRKLCVIFFLFVYLFSSTELSELLKIDALIEHYSEHKKVASSISFSDFLYSHYIDHGADNGDGDKDSQLPFHSNSHPDFVNFILPVILPSNHYSISFIQSIENKSINIFFKHKNFRSSSYLSTIWQPPQV